MAKSARRYDIYLPLTFNDGRAIPDERFDAVEDQLLGRFGGVTSLQRKFPLRGIWQGTSLSRPVIIITVLDFRPRGSGRFITRLKRSLLRDFEQAEILITESSIRVY